MRTAHIRDSYYVSLWLTPEAIAYLDSQFPNDESEIALAKLVDRAMRSSRNSKPRSLEIGQRDRFGGEDKRSLIVQPALTPEPVSKLPAPLENPIGKLQEKCQLQKTELPSYNFSNCREGYSCTCSALGTSAIGIGRLKRDAKRDSAIALLELLG